MNDWLKQFFTASRSWLFGPAAVLQVTTIPSLADELVESALEAMFVMDRQDRVLMVNPAAVRMFGWQPEELIGQVLHEMLHHHHPDGQPYPITACPLAGVMETGIPLENVDDWLLARDGSWVPVRCSQVPRFENGAVIGCTLVVHDRREAYRMESTLREHAEALAAASRRKDAFLIMLAHELRNPLGPMRTAVSIMKRDRVGEAAERSRAVLERQVTHMARLVDDLLDVSRIMRGRIRLQLQPVDLHRLVEEAIEDHRPELIQEGRQLVVTLDPGVNELSADPARLRQVIDNLLSNARKFTEPGGTIHVHLKKSDRLLRTLLQVTDNGIGIEPHEIAAMFESFAQADASLDRARGGLGLGLALARGLIELHGGQVWGESAGLGQGATFTVALPFRDPGQGPAETPAPERSRMPGRRILVIEDNLDAATLLEDFLQIMGHVTSAAYTGPSGLEQARAIRPDVILCDLGLPGMDGFQIARHLRADPLFSHLHLIAVTGYGADEDRAATRAAGFDHHLVKPVDPDTLAELLEHLDDRPLS